MTDDPKKSKDESKQKDIVRKEIQEKGKQSVVDKYRIDPDKPYKPHTPKRGIREQ